MSGRAVTLTPAEQVVRWFGLGAVVAAVVLGVAQVARPLVLMLLIGGIGCYIAMSVLASRRRKTG